MGPLLERNVVTLAASPVGATKNLNEVVTFSVTGSATSRGKLRYTAQVSGFGNATGVPPIEIYEMPN